MPAFFTNARVSRATFYSGPRYSLSTRCHFPFLEHLLLIFIVTQRPTYLNHLLGTSTQELSLVSVSLALFMREPQQCDIKNFM